MTRAEISTIIKSATEQLNPVTRYGRGLRSDFNSIRSEEYPAVWQETLPDQAYNTSTLNINETPIDNAPITLWIAQWDKPDSNVQQYEDILDNADLIARKLIYLINQNIQGLVTSSSKQPFIKQNADCLTGIKLLFTITSEDLTVNCE